MITIARKKLSKKLIIASALLGLLLVGVGVVWSMAKTAPPKIYSTYITDIAEDATVTSSTGQPPPAHALQAAPRQVVSFESKVVPVAVKANAAVLEWAQEGQEGTTIEARTFNGQQWSPWTETTAVDGGKDGVAVEKSSSLILANNIQKLQYRFHLQGSENQPSASINASEASLQTIDSSQGPNGSPSIVDVFIGFLNPHKPAKAKADGPRIISRAEWGCPEPDSSVNWPPEYRELGRAVVHHTATTESPNAFAAIRAIWQYHTHNLTWGDIGYNYLVDSAGNIFQGRYYDKAHAEANRVEVKGGHAYNNNDGTTGVAAIGNFEHSAPTGVQMAAVSNIIAFKLARFELNPNGNGPFGTTVVGHRDVYPSACPGVHLYPRLQFIRELSSQYYRSYDAANKLDYGFAGQRLFKDGEPIATQTVLNNNDNIELAINLVNKGTEAWRNDTSYKTVLGTTHPTDRASAFYDPASWIAPNRVGSFSTKVNPETGGVLATNVIEPGEIAQFRFKLKVPDLINSSNQLSTELFAEYFKPVQDGRAWFPRNIGLHFPLTVERHSYSWQWLGQTLYTDNTKTTPVNPTAVAPNTRYYTVLQLQNTGTATWYQGRFRLGTHQPGDRSSVVYDHTWLSINRPATLVEPHVAPASTGTIEFWIKTPNETSFTLKEYFRPVQDGVTWLNDVGLFWELRHPHPSPAPIGVTR